MTHRVFLHVGTPKSGTTYLQSLWWRHHDALAQRGLLLPGTERGDHFHAASVVCDRTATLAHLTPDRLRIWNDLLAETGRWSGDALISHELFSPATPTQAAAALRSLHEVADEVHVIMTARDLARQLPSAWQQIVKQGDTRSLAQFWAHLSAADPEGGFWMHHDIPAILGRWTAGLPAAHVHLVVQPPTPPEGWLWDRSCALLGVDGSDLDVEAPRGNPSLGVVEVEVMRRMHEAMPERERGLPVARVAKGFMARQALAPSGPGEPFVLSAEMQAWALRRGTQMVSALTGLGYDVVGDLADLAPERPVATGRLAGEVTEQEVAATAVAALARMVVRERDRVQQVERLRGELRQLRERPD